MSEMMVSGVIGSDGTKLSGHGFTVTSQGNGEYIISFSPPFSAIPAIVGSQVNYEKTSQDTRDNVIFPYVNTGAATAITGDSTGDHTNRTFAFIANGDGPGVAAKA
jgi:hypothetical protein